jgi:xanthosine utilization system XapX-like protein
MYGALGTAGLYGASQLAQQDPLGAFTGTLGSLVGGGVGAGIAKLIPGPAGKVAQFALPVLGGLFGGMGTEQVVTGLAGKAQESGQRPGGGADVEVAGVPLTETAATRKQREFDRAQNLQDIQQIGGAQLALDKELLGYMMTKEVEQAKAMSPIIERAQRAQLTNAQAMLNSQSAAYQQLGRSAMMGRSTIVGQQERGATMRQALASNPYIGATLQAPSISFG